MCPGWSGCCPVALTLALGVPGGPRRTGSVQHALQPRAGAGAGVRQWRRVEAGAAPASEERMTAVIGRGGAGHL